MSLDFRAVIDALLPRGSAWAVQVRNDLDKFWDGFAKNAEDAYLDFIELAIIRDPYRVSLDLLPDLEREYGILPNDDQTEQERRDILAATMFAKRGTGSASFLEDQIRAAGFDLYVTENNPAVDPRLLLSQNAPMTLGDVDAFVGYEGAVLGFGSELIVNEDPQRSPQSVDFYEIPKVRNRWNFVFFVGGVATGWPTNPIITPGVVPSSSRGALTKIILKYKPLHSWCVPVIDYV